MGSSFLTQQLIALGDISSVNHPEGPRSFSVLLGQNIV